MMLVLEGLHAGYAQGAVLHGIDLQVPEGKVVCLIGRNGAGKTSAMRAVVHDLIQIGRGRVVFDGADITHLPAHAVIRLGIAYVPEDRRVFANLTVAENLAVPKPWRIAGGGADWTIARVVELFPQLGQFMSRKAGVLSGGQQQMLTIARSLLTNPRLLLLDEPNEGLAPVVADEVIAAINRLKAEGVSMVVSEQHLRLVNECADHIYAMDRGTIVFSGSPADLAANPDVVRKYITLAQH